MPLQQPRLQFARPTIMQLSRLLADFSSLKSSAADKTALIAGADALIQDVIDNGDGDTAWVAALNQLKTDIEALLIGEINVLTDFQTAITATFTDPNGCPQCTGLGKIPSTIDKSLVATDPGVDSGIYVTCPLCMGEGITEGPYQAVYDPTVIPDYNPI